MNLPLVTPENAPRDAAGLQLLSRPKRYNLALAMGMFPNESPEEQAFIAADDQTQVHALQTALAHRDAAGGGAPPQQQYAPPPQYAPAPPPQYAPAPQQQYAPAPVPQYAPPPQPPHYGQPAAMQAPVVPQPMVMTPQPLAMPPQYVQPGMQPGHAPPQPGYALPPAPQVAPPSGRLPPAPQVAQQPQYAPQQQMPPQYAPQLPPAPVAPPPQAAQPQRVPQTMGDPGNAGQGLSQAAQLNELKGIILGMARTQNMLALLVLELSSHQLGVDKQSLAALAVRNSLAGEPESLFEAAVSLGKAG